MVQRWVALDACEPVIEGFVDVFDQSQSPPSSSFFPRDTAVRRRGPSPARRDMSLLMGEWKHLRRTPPGGVPADAPASPPNHLHLRALPGRESKSFATGDGPPSFFSSALPLLEPPIETPLPLPVPPLNPRRARGRASIDAVTALTELKRSLDFDVSEERGSASRVAGGRSRTSRRPREDMNAAMMPLLATVPTAAGPGAPKALPELPKDIEEMSYRELKVGSTRSFLPDPLAASTRLSFPRTTTPSSSGRRPTATTRGVCTGSPRLAT